MAYACANCQIEHANPRALVQHMLERHNSPFIEGDEKLTRISKEEVEKLEPTRKAKMKELLGEFGVI